MRTLDIDSIIEAASTPKVSEPPKPRYALDIDEDERDYLLEVLHEKRKVVNKTLNDEKTKTATRLRNRRLREIIRGLINGLDRWPLPF